VSLVTLVQITKEKEPKRASTPGPDPSIQSHLQNEHEVESYLEFEPLDIPSNPMDGSRDEI